VIAQFLGKIGGIGARFSALLSAGEQDLLRREAHEIVSESGYLGAMRVSLLAREVEHASRPGSTDDLERRVELFTSAVRDAETALQAWLAGSEA